MQDRLTALDTALMADPQGSHYHHCLHLLAGALLRLPSAPATEVGTAASAIRAAICIIDTVAAKYGQLRQRGNTISDA
ncbi:hypothetical protein HAX39_24600 [Citrobacter freundii]|nr:hypothetical protein [Citrobacter freundii]